MPFQSIPVSSLVETAQDFLKDGFDYTVIELSHIFEPNFYIMFEEFSGTLPAPISPSHMQFIVPTKMLLYKALEIRRDSLPLVHIEFQPADDLGPDCLVFSASDSRDFDFEWDFGLVPVVDLLQLQS